MVKKHFSKSKNTVLLFFSPFRHANPGDAPSGHPPHAGQRPPPLFLCILHIWHHRGSIVGWTAETEMPHTGGTGSVHHQESLLRVST